MNINAVCVIVSRKKRGGLGPFLNCYTKNWEGRDHLFRERDRGKRG